MEISIADVIAVNGVEVLNPQKGTCVCPFCGDSRGKFAFSASKNVFNCFRCGEHGGMFELHKRLNPLPEFAGADGNKAVAKHLRDLMGGESYTVKRTEFLKQVVNDRAKDEAKRKSDDEISVVYRHLLSSLRLKDAHREDLKRRGLTEEQIKAFGFCSVPSDTQKLCSILLKKGLQLEGIPGFYQQKNGAWNMAVPRGEGYVPKSGYFCPALDEEGRVVGMQIRVDDPGESGAKYVWFSSAERKLGTPSGALATCLPGENEKCLVITEGILKATIVWYLLQKKVTVIGIPGVNNRKSVIPYIEQREKAFACVAFDMDRFVNEKVMTAEESLVSMLHSYNIDTHSLTWDIDKNGVWKEQEKGLDDFLAGNPTVRAPFLRHLFSLTRENLLMKQIFF